MSSEAIEDKEQQKQTRSKCRKETRTKVERCSADKNKNSRASAARNIESGRRASMPGSGMEA